MNICRCCLSTDESNKDTSKNYEEMFLKTFNLNISHPYILFNICDGCLHKLQQALAFKQQVIDTEPMWLESVLKINIAGEMKMETEEKSLDINSQENCSQNDTASDDDVSKYNVATKNKIRRKNGPKKDIKKKPTKDTKVKDFLKDLRENTLKLVTNSNLCIFKILKRKYSCYDCPQTFLHIKELREHAIMNHKSSTITDRLKRLSGMTFYNADISNLSCKICDQMCENLDDLKDHLIGHGVLFGKGGHCLVPYRIEESFQCVICNDIFDTFLMLCRHMNIHSTSNVCETCGAAFFNRQSLRSHIRNNHREAKCRYCSVIFPQNRSLQIHISKTHKTMLNRKRYCIQCNQIFTYTYLLKNHMVLKHGESEKVFRCPYCAKTAKCKGALQTHIRFVHLKERNYKCSVCDAKFFTKFDEVRHERTHLDVRVYCCDVCNSRFKSKDSMRRHLKKQHGFSK